MKNKKVKPVNPDSIGKRFDFATKDVSLRNKWNDLEIHNYDRFSPREKNYVIDSPPPTASGELHQGHIFSYTHLTQVILKQPLDTNQNLLFCFIS